MEAIQKYSLNPLATCFFPSNMKVFYDSVTLDQKISNNLPKNNKYAAFNSENGLPVVKNYWTQNAGTISVSNMLDFDLLIFNKDAATEEPSPTVDRNPTVHLKRVVMAERPGKLNGNGISKRRFKNGISIREICEGEQERFKDKVDEKTDLLESAKSLDCTNTCMEMERFDLSENMSLMEPERYKDNDENTCLMALERPEDNNCSVELEVNENDRKDENCLVESERPNCISDNCVMELNTNKTTDIEDAVIRTVKCLYTSDSLNLELYRWTKRNFAVSFYIAWMLSAAYCPQIALDGNATDYMSKTTFGKTDKLENDCVFGCIIPFEFDSPSKLAKRCNKKSVLASFEHVSDENLSDLTDFRKTLYDECKEQSADSGNCSEDESCTGEKTADEIWEELSMEFKAIIKDVCDTFKTFSLGDCEIEQFIQKDLKSSKRPVWFTPDETENLDLVDDGCHPLLDNPPLPDKDFSEDIALIQKFLGKAMAFGEKSSEVVEPQYSSSSCNPPCSVWCNRVPTHAVDTYKRFKKLKSHCTVNSNVETCKIPSRPFYKRSFSADDTRKVLDYENVSNLASKSELRDKLLFAKDRADSKDFSVIYFDGGRKYGSSLLSLEQDTKIFSKGKGSDTWSLYDSVDSMWQRLPDCVPSSDHAQKHSRRARDMRRQRSVC